MSQNQQLGGVLPSDEYQIRVLVSFEGDTRPR